MEYYLHIVLPLMHLYIKRITDDLLVTVRCGIHVRDIKLL